MPVDMEDSVAEEHFAILGVALCGMSVGVADVVEDGDVSGLGDDDVAKCFLVEVAELEGELSFHFCGSISPNMEGALFMMGGREFGDKGVRNVLEWSPLRITLDLSHSLHTPLMESR